MNRELGMNRRIMNFENCDIGFESVLINDLNLCVEEGDFISVVGPTGIGKSTLLRLISHVDREARRPVVLNGIWEKAENLSTGIVFQSLEQLLPWKTAIDNVKLPNYSSRLHSKGRMSKRDAESRARLLLEMVDLSDHEDKYPADLSGGMRQRVAIARAMFLNPELLLMDEPFGSLDAITRSRLQDMLIKFHRESNLSIIFVTHDISEAVKLSDKILVIGQSGECELFKNDDSSGREELVSTILDCIKN